VGRSDEVAVCLEQVAKAYKLYDRPFDFLREALTGRPYHRNKVVLSDVSLTLKRGEILGIIGRNGAGKSTLLKIIAGTLAATQGNVRVNGRVAAILELGTGFNPNYSGRDNVVLSALMRGMSEEAVKRKFDSIVAFAGLENVIDEPFHTYSSGMQARLAFAAATAVEADVILIDEALAAGDMSFAARSLRRIHEICQTGVAAIFVSHTTYHVIRLCTRAIWIDDGRIRMDGVPIEVTRAYDYAMLDAIARDKAQTGGSLETMGNWRSGAGTNPEAQAQAPVPADTSGLDPLPNSAHLLKSSANGTALLLRPISAQSPVPAEAPEPAEPALVEFATRQAAGPADAEPAAAAPEQSRVAQTELETARAGGFSRERPDDELVVEESAAAPYAPLNRVSSALENSDACTIREMTQSASTFDKVVAAIPQSPAAVKDELSFTEAQRNTRFSTGQYRMLDIAFFDRAGRRTRTFRFGEVLRLVVAYECLMPELPEYSCGLAVAFRRTTDFEPVMYFNTNYPHSDEELLRYFDVPFRNYFGRAGRIEAVIDPLQLRAGEYYVSLGLLPNQPGPPEFYEFERAYCRINVLANGFDEPSVFYPIVRWTNGPPEN
jgi:ABC-type polysaccharide/polyol phosphate transport system ATPase subunit